MIGNDTWYGSLYTAFHDFNDMRWHATAGYHKPTFTSFDDDVALHCDCHALFHI
jgi:hypothetical protein